MSKNQAFTLVELALAFTIIVIIYNLAIQGKELIEDSKLKALVAEIKSYEAAAVKFYNKFGSIPGDYTDVASVSSSNLLVPGDGDGLISNRTEELQFWLHLQQANLISGNLDGSTYSLSTSSQIGGLISSKINSKIFYDIESDMNISRLILVIAKYSPDGKYHAVFTPAEAASLAANLKSNEASLELQVLDGEDVETGSCIRNNSYNFQNSRPACYIKYAFSEFKLNNSLQANFTACQGSSLGFTRRSDQMTCPSGYEGYVEQICTLENGGTWQNFDYECREIQCQNQLYLNQTINLLCPINTAGYIKLICNNLGLFSLDNSLCAANYECDNSGRRRNLVCPLGSNNSTSKWLQVCSAQNLWQDIEKNCIPQTCDGQAIGSQRSSNLVENVCPEGFQVSEVGQVEACVMTVDGANWRLIQDNCLYSYNGGCSAGTERVLICPKSKNGYVNQVCNKGGFYETTEDTCTNARCGGQKIGSFQIRQDLFCPAGQSGQVIQVCDYVDDNMQEATWQVSYQNCQTLFCPAISDGVGNVVAWPESAANNIVKVNCSSIGTATRYCQSDGNWSPTADTSCN